MTNFRTLACGQIFTCGLAALGLLTVAPAVAQPQDVLRIQLNADIRSTDPGINRDANSDAVVMNVLEGLVAFREDATVGPMLAESVETSADGRSYTFKLRKGITFHDGTPLTASDVLFDWQRYMAPQNNWRCLPEFDGSGRMKVTGVEAPDPLTVRFTLAEPSALFLTTLARVDCGGTGIYARSSIGADGKWIKPVGTGPFKFEAWVPGQYIDLSRNDTYAPLPGKPDGYAGNKTPRVAGVRFMIIPDPSAAKAALLSGGIDVIPDIAVSDMAELRENADVKVQSKPTMELNAILFQTKDPLMSDPRIRQALALSLDVPQLVQAVTEGEGKPNRSLIPVSSAYYGEPEAKMPERDLDAARKLLTEAGYKGQPIRMLTSKHYQYLYDMAVLVQAMTEEAGIKIELEVLDWATLLDHYTKGDYQAAAFSYSARLDPSLSFDMVSGDKAKAPRKVWDNPAALALLRQSTQIADKAQRQALIDQMEAMFRTDVPMIAVYNPAAKGATRANVEGFEVWSLSQPRGWGVTLK